MLKNFIEKAEMVAGLNAIAVAPSKEDVDYERIYKYTEGFPEFGMFAEEKPKYKESHAKELGQIMLNGDWIGDRVKISVDINTLCVASHNHTYGGYIWARMHGFDKPLYVEYVDVPQGTEERLATILVDEHTKKYEPRNILKVFMAKPGEEPTIADKVFNYCMGHPFLRKNGENNYNLSAGLSVLFGEFKPYTKVLKKGHMFNIRNKKVDWTSYDVLDKALAIKDAIHTNKVTGMECFLRMWYKFYKEDDLNYSYLNSGGWEKFIAATPKVVEAMGGFQLCQVEDYTTNFFKDILAVAKGKVTPKTIKERAA